MDFIFLLNALLKKKWVILICALAGFAAGFLFTLTQKKLYLSAATYSTGFTMRKTVKLTEDEGLNNFEIDQRFKNVIETFKSPTVISMLSYDLMLHDLEDPRPFTVLTEKDLIKPEYVSVNKDEAKRILRAKKAKTEMLEAYDSVENKVYELIRLYKYDNESILEELQVGQVQGTDYLNILFRSENPKMSAFVVNTIGKEFISFYGSITSGRTVESSTKLDSLLIEKRKEIDKKTRELQAFKASFGSANVADRGTAAMSILGDRLKSETEEKSKLNELEGQLTSVNTQLASLGVSTGDAGNSNAEIIRLTNENRRLSGELAAKGGSDATIQNKIDANKRRLLELGSGRSNDNSEKLEVRRKRDELTAQRIGLENQIRAQKINIAAISRDVSKYEGISKQGAGADVVVKSMETDIEILTREYEGMLGANKGAQDINVAPDINFKQTLLGQPAIKPESSNRKLIVGVAALASMFIAMLLIIVFDFMDSSLRAPSIFSRTIPLKLLSVVNKVDLKGRELETLFEVTAQGRQKIDDSFVENIRKLRYEIETAGKKTILFTSTKTGEGKSTIIEALANSFSLSKKKVLLIDANFTNNTLSQKFQAKPALEQFSFKGDGDKLMNAISMTRIPNVDIVGCEEGKFSPAEILPKNNLFEHLDQVSKNYDYILIEGAALNMHADSKELSHYVSSMVAVFAASSVIKQADKESLRFLESTGTKMTGAVLNRVDKDNMDL